MTDSTAEDRRRRKLVESVKGAVVRLFDAALVSGGAARGYLRQLGFTGPVSDGLDVVDNKHFIEGSNAAWRGPRSARKKYRLPERYFLMVGKLEAGKDQRTALSAAAQAFDAGLPSTFRFLLAGEGTCRGELEAHSRDLGIRDRVKFLGPVAYEDLPSLYAMATALILPSRSETWGLVVNESLACGTPVIVSRVCGCAGDLVHRGRTGLTFEPGDAEALSRAMVAVARSPKRRRVWASDCRRLVARWGPERFAAGAVAAVKNARARRRSALSPFERGFLRILSGLLDGMAWKRVAPR
jgi:glycosyltransferase involved in cell wall biosynthesis